MNTRDMKAEIARLEENAEGSDLPKNTAARLKGLQKALTARLKKRERIIDFRELEAGEEATFEGKSYGAVTQCPVCNELGARRRPKWANGATIFVHSLEAVPSLVDLLRYGNNGQLTDSGAHGRFRLKDDFHYVAADGTLVMPAEKKKTAREPIVKSVQKSSGAPAAGSRRAAALKAWETIRARRAARAVAIAA
jgi:hypothetical protein